MDINLIITKKDQDTITQCNDVFQKFFDKGFNIGNVKHIVIENEDFSNFLYEVAELQNKIRCFFSNLEEMSENDDLLKEILYNTDY